MKGGRKKKKRRRRESKMAGVKLEMREREGGNNGRTKERF